MMTPVAGIQCITGPRVHEAGHGPAAVPTRHAGWIPLPLLSALHKLCVYF